MCMQRVAQKGRSGEGARVTAMFILPYSVPVYSTVLCCHIIGLCDHNHRMYMLGVFFFFYRHYNPLWVLAFSVILFHSVLSLHNFLHPLIPILCISSSTSSISLFLGLPLILLPVGFHCNTLLGVLFIHLHHVT